MSRGGGETLVNANLSPLTLYTTDCYERVLMVILYCADPEGLPCLLLGLSELGQLVGTHLLDIFLARLGRGQESLKTSLSSGNQVQSEPSRLHVARNPGSTDLGRGSALDDAGLGHDGGNLGGGDILTGTGDENALGGGLHLNRGLVETAVFVGVQTGEVGGLATKVYAIATHQEGAIVADELPLKFSRHVNGVW